jgi:ABC-type sugar transport system substrate-binding protein
MNNNLAIFIANFSKTYRLFLFVTFFSLFCHLSWGNVVIEPKENIVNKVSVLLVNPSIENDPFWYKVEQITKHAAHELSIDLTIIHGYGTRFFQLDELNKYFKENPPPKYVVLVNYPGHAKLTMNLLERHKVKVITLEQTISDDEKAFIGAPGERYKNWIGEVYFNNEIASYKLAKSLISRATLTHNSAVVAGISGHYGSESTLRNNGVRSAIKESTNAQLTQIVHASWSFEDAYNKTLKLLKRYPDINVIWSASDHMALAAIKAIKAMDKKIGIDILVGGFDWTQKGIESIYNKELTASIGGHFLMGAIAMMAIHSEEQGIEHVFFSNNKYSSFELALIKRDNIQQYYHLLQSEDLSQVSFKKLVQIYNSRQSLSAIDLLKVLEKSSTPIPFN